MIALDDAICADGFHTASCVRRIIAHVATFILTEDPDSREALLDQFRANPDVTGSDANLLAELIRPLSESILGKPETAGISDPGNDGASGRQRDAGFRSLAERRGSDSLEEYSPPTILRDDIDHIIQPTPPRPSFFEPINACPMCGSGAIRLGSRYAEAPDYEQWECFDCGTSGGGASYWRIPSP